ncbi:MAG: TRAP transporter substrate-binding protein [Ostreibacterium sp.]
MKKTLLRQLLITILAVFSSVAIATELTVSTWGSPKHGINTMLWPTWGEWIKEVTHGRVTLNVVYNLGPPNTQMDIVADGVGDVSWIFNGFYPGRFSTTTLPEMPTFNEISSEKLSRVYWKTYNKYLKKANEYKGLVVAAVAVHGPGSVLTKEKVIDLSQLIQKRIRVGGGVMSAIAKKFNLSGVSMPPTAIYEAASQGVITGAFLTLESLKSFRLAEVFPYTLTFPGGLYRGSFAIVINQDKWNEISPKDQVSIMAVSGEKLSALFGKMMDEQDAVGVTFAKSKGNVFTAADDKTIAEVKKLATGMPEQWIKNNRGKGFDPQAAMAFYQAQLKK